MINQLTVFLGNEEGRLAAATRTLANANINMHALNIAETADYGILRIICDTPEAAKAALREAGYQASLTPVIAVEVANEAGSLATVLEKFEEMHANIDYGYCFSNGDKCVDILKVQKDGIEAEMTAAGFTVLTAEEIYAVE